MRYRCTAATRHTLPCAAAGARRRRGAGHGQRLLARRAAHIGCGQQQAGNRLRLVRVGAGNDQRGFSGYEHSGSSRQSPPHDLNNELKREVRPDRFSMGALSLAGDPFAYDAVGIFAPEPDTQPRNRFTEAYLQCNYPYRPLNRAAFKGLSTDEAAAKLTRNCADTIPPYWLNLFHGQEDSRVTTGTIIREMRFLSWLSSPSCLSTPLSPVCTRCIRCICSPMPRRRRGWRRWTRCLSRRRRGRRGEYLR